MSKGASKERKQIINAFGANLILTNEKEGTDGAIKKVFQLIRNEPKRYVHLNQYANKNNLLSHYKTTGPEIWKQTNGNITHLVAGIGTSGTINGIGKFLKEKNPNITLVAAHPQKNEKLDGLKDMENSIVPKLFNKNKLDEIINVTREESLRKNKELAKQGFFVGISSGAAMVVAERVATKNPNSKIVVIFPDSGEKYLSTYLSDASH